MWPLPVQRRLQETRGFCQSVLPINMSLHCPNGQGDLDRGNVAATPSVPCLPPCGIGIRNNMLCANCPDISPHEPCERQYSWMSRSFSRPTLAIHPTPRAPARLGTIVLVHNNQFRWLVTPCGRCGGADSDQLCTVHPRYSASV